MQLVKDVLTSKDGESFNYAKVWGSVILLAWLSVSFVAVLIYKLAVDLNAWGGVTTAIYATINGAIRGTHVTEPDQ